MSVETPVFPRTQYFLFLCQFSSSSVESYEGLCVQRDQDHLDCYIDPFTLNFPLRGTRKSVTRGTGDWGGRRDKISENSGQPDEGSMFIDYVLFSRVKSRVPVSDLVYI